MGSHQINQYKASIITIDGRVLIKLPEGLCHHNNFIWIWAQQRLAAPQWLALDGSAQEGSQQGSAGHEGQVWPGAQVRLRLIQDDHGDEEAERWQELEQELEDEDQHLHLGLPELNQMSPLDAVPEMFII